MAILTKPEAHATYNAMCAINSVDGYLAVCLPRGEAGDALVSQRGLRGPILIEVLGARETFASRAEFALAYSLLGE